MQRAHLDHIMVQVLDFAPDVSDVVMTPGKPIQAEEHGQLKDVPIPGMGRLTPFQTEALALCLMGPNRRFHEDLAAHGSADLSYELTGRGRFRVNVFSRLGSLCTVMRKLPSAIPDAETLDLPATILEASREKFGLVLVTGATGSGKSTTLAAVIDSINASKAVHILTLEDPVEFVHPHKMGTVNQREMGVDFDHFASGLRAALRQAPKVILVGEIRDRETVEIAMQAAETGHLVLGTLHTADTGQTISRILGMFDPSQERQTRLRLAESLKFIVSQRLVPKVGGGRAAAFEILRNTLRIRDLILAGETVDKTFYSVVEAGSTYGMVTFDQSLARLFEEGTITEETALASGSDRSRLIRMLDATKSARGEAVSDIRSEDLTLESDSGEEE